MIATQLPKDTMELLRKKYEHERTKRLKKEGNNQYIDARSKSLQDFNKDPWVDYNDPRVKSPPLKDGDNIKFLVAGAGINGVVDAGRLIEAGFDKKDVVCVDTAGGFGGVWYVKPVCHKHTLTKSAGTIIVIQELCAMLKDIATSRFSRKRAISLDIGTRMVKRSGARSNEVQTTSEFKDSFVQRSTQRFGTRTRSSGLSR